MDGVAQLIGPSEGALSKVMLSKPLTHEKEEEVPRLAASQPSLPGEKSQKQSSAGVG